MRSSAWRGSTTGATWWLAASRMRLTSLMTVRLGSTRATCMASSGGLCGLQEVLDPARQAQRLILEQRGGREQFGGHVAGLGGAVLDADDVRSDLPGADGGVVYVGADLMRGFGLPRHRVRDRQRDGVDLIDRLRDGVDRQHGIAGGGLNILYLARDPLGRLRRLRR